MKNQYWIVTYASGGEFFTMALDLHPAEWIALKAARRDAQGELIPIRENIIFAMKISPSQYMKIGKALYA